MERNEFYREIAVTLERGESVALCTIIETTGSTPRGAGTKMLVFAGGRISGTIGGGEMENRAVNEALLALENGRPLVWDASLVEPDRGDPGVCGGTLRVFIEPILPKMTVVVAGAGHVGKAVASLAKWLGLRVVVSDDRPELCTPEAVPDADAWISCALSDLPKHTPITASTYLVLTTRNLGVDVEGLPALLATPARYIGVIGSQRRWLTAQKKLLAAGVSKEALARISSPIGLELHAETPEEIAVSIMAEIIMVERGGDGTRMSGTSLQG